MSQERPFTNSEDIDDAIMVINVSTRELLAAGTKSSFAMSWSENLNDKNNVCKHISSSYNQ